MKKLLSTIAYMAAAVAVFSACSGKSQKQELPDMSQLPAYVADVSVTLNDSDARAFAALVQYPLPRPYPLHDITDSARMVAYYPVMIDDSLRSMLARAGSWEDFGWRGWALDDGEIWVDEDGVYDIGYMSKAEKAHYTSLVDREMASLPPDMRDGFTPVACYRAADGEAVYRIDHRPADNSYRLAIYNKGARRDTRPDRMLTGTLHTEGSAMARHYEFTDPKGSVTLSADTFSDDDMPYLTFDNGRASTETEITPAYWLDLIN